MNHDEPYSHSIVNKPNKSLIYCNLYFSSRVNTMNNTIINNS